MSSRRSTRKSERTNRLTRAAGPYATGGASFTYVTGPDGKQYAVGGEVKIDISPEAGPEATLRKAEAIQAAAADETAPRLGAYGPPPPDDAGRILSLLA